MARDVTRLFVRRAIDLRRFGNGLARRSAQLLANARDDAIARLARISPGSLGRRSRLNALVRQIDETLDSRYSQLHSEVVTELRGLAQNQVDFTTAALRRAVGTGAAGLVQSVVLGETMLASIVDTNPVHGAVLRDWFSRQAADTAFNFRRQIQIGLSQQETIDQLVQRVRGTFAGGRFRGGVFGQAARGTEAVVRTAVNHVATTAEFETLRANDDITDEYQYVATLDDRTTEICASLDGQTFRYDDESAPRPPQHFGCRSTIAAVVKWDELGIDPPPEGTRSAQGGTVPGDTNYAEWLRRQPVSVQDDVLGVGKAELFRSGRITLRDLVRTDGGVVTLQELRARFG